MTRQDTVPEIPDLVRNEGRVFLLGAHCEECGNRMFPHRGHCTECLRATARCTFDRRAELESFTEVFAGAPRFETPYVAGLVRLSPGNVRTFAYLDDDADAFEVGSPVEVAAGTIADRNDWVFRPVEHGE